jgi:glycosyltransferase involved in cell wall biosynthesis
MEEPFVSIIIASRDRKNVLLETLAIGCNIIKDQPGEIIVINDGDIPIEIPQDIFTQIHYLENPGRGVSSARNHGASKAKGDILFFIDDDMWITQQTLKKIYELHKDDFLKNNAIVMNWEYPEKLQKDMSTKKIGRYILRSNYHTLEGRLHKKIDYTQPLLPINGIGSGSFVIDKKIFKNIGGYNENIYFQGEDIDITNRMIKQKINIYLSTEITCFHNQSDRLDLNNFLQRTEQGYQSQVNSGVMEMKESKVQFYQFLLPFVSTLKLLYSLTPNIPFFDLITFRLIGSLSALTYTKAIRNGQS